MTDVTMAMGLSLTEIDLLLDLVGIENNPTAKLLQHRLWRLRSGLLRKMLLSGDLADRLLAARLVEAAIDNPGERLRLVTD